jgi:dTMP kinase
MGRGVFITFEGPEGGGKSTQMRRLAERLRARGCEVVCVREPGGTPIGEAIRGLLQHDEAGEPPVAECEVFLFLASRAHLARTVIRPAMERGACVLCDRYADSTLAYQGYGRGFPVETLRALNAFAIGDCVPDLTLLLDLEIGQGFARLAARHGADAAAGPDRMEREAAAFHHRVREGFLELARAEPQRWRVISAAGREDDVAATIAREADDVLERLRD